MGSELETHDSLENSSMEGDDDNQYETKGSEFNMGDENSNNSRPNLDVKRNLDGTDQNFLPETEANGLILSE